MMDESQPAVASGSLDVIVSSLSIGQQHSVKVRDDHNVTYTKLSPEAAREELRKRHADQADSTSYYYEGSGRLCPVCHQRFVLVSKYTSSDGMCGVERGTWVCPQADCGIRKEERYEGYGTIF